MPEIVIKYKNKRTLEALMDFAKYFDFSVVSPETVEKKKTDEIKGVKIIRSNKSIDTSELEHIFTGKNLDAKTIRKESWQRNL